MRFVIPLPYNRANSRLHWRTLDRRRRDYFYLLDCLHMSRATIPEDVCWRFPDPPATPMARASITATLYTKRKMDTDNLFGRLKWCGDWLVTRGFIVDDSPDHLEWAAIPAQAIDRRDPRVEIEITEIAA